MYPFLALSNSAISIDIFSVFLFEDYYQLMKRLSCSSKFVFQHCDTLFERNGTVTLIGYLTLLYEVPE